MRLFSFKSKPSQEYQKPTWLSVIFQTDYDQYVVEEKNRKFKLKVQLKNADNDREQKK